MQGEIKCDKNRVSVWGGLICFSAGLLHSQSVKTHSTDICTGDQTLSVQG